MKVGRFVRLQENQYSEPISKQNAWLARLLNQTVDLSSTSSISLFINICFHVLKKSQFN